MFARGYRRESCDETRRRVESEVAAEDEEDEQVQRQLDAIRLRDVDGGVVAETLGYAADRDGVSVRHRVLNGRGCYSIPMAHMPQLSARYLHEFQNSARAELMQFSADTLPGASDRTFAVYTEGVTLLFEWYEREAAKYEYHR